MSQDKEEMATPSKSQTVFRQPEKEVSPNKAQNRESEKEQNIANTQSGDNKLSQKAQDITRKHFTDAINTIMKTKADTVTLDEGKEKLDSSAQIARTPDLSDIARQIRRKPEASSKQKLNDTVERDVKQLQAKTGLKISMDLKDGEKGVYKGMHEIAHRDYGLLDKGDGTAKLIPARHMECREKGKTVQVEKRTLSGGKEVFKGVRAHGREQAKSKGRELDF